MPKEILINIEPQEKRAAIVEDGRLEEFYIERPQDKTIVGNIYKGKIEAILPAVGAAFVDIGLVKKGFLYLSERQEEFESFEPTEAKPREFKKGENVLVQVVKESFGTKGPRLSSHIGLPGRYLVLMPQDSRLGVSRRIEDDQERRRLRQLLQEAKLPKGMGFIVRTAALARSKQELIRDAYFLIKLWKRIEKIVQNKSAPALIYEEYDLTFRVIRDYFTDDVSKLIVDSKAEYSRLIHFMRVFLSHLRRKVELYKGEDLFTEKDIEKQINRIFENTVYLKSKGYIIIEPTEGLVVIDVNSGGFKKSIRQEEAAFRVNCEAAHEIARQLRLRNLGGIIVIDFIDMEKEAHRREVFNVLKKALSLDKAKYDISGISKFGLIELTRERVRNTVYNITYQKCPYCQGKAKVRSALSMSIYALKELRRFLRGKSLKEVSLTLSPVVVDNLLKDKAALRFIEQRFRIKVNLVSNPTFHIEEVKIS